MIRTLLRTLLLVCLTVLTLAASPAGAAASLSAPAHHSVGHQPAGITAPTARHCADCPDGLAGGHGGAATAPTCCIGMACTSATGTDPLRLVLLKHASILRYLRPLSRLHRARSPHPEPHPPQVPVTI